MVVAASECRFERAAALRDHLSNLQWLARRLTSLRTAQQDLNGVVPIAARNRKTIWLVLRGGRLIGSAAQPDQTDRAIKAIDFLSQTAAISLSPPSNLLEMNLQLILISWFRKNPHQQQQLLSFESAIQFCQARIKQAA